MRCAIVSRAGQVLAQGRLQVQQDEVGELWLQLQTDSGQQLSGGKLDRDGDMTAASQVLASRFFEVWGMSDLSLTVLLR